MKSPKVIFLGLALIAAAEKNVTLHRYLQRDHTTTCCD